MPIDEVSPATAARRGLGAVGALAGLGAAGLTYAWWEARWFTLRHVEVPVLPAGAPELRVLHLSDVHLTPYQGRKREWLASLAGLSPDLVVDTGDNLAHRDAVPVLLDELGGLLDVPGVFVLGSNDYFEPTVRNPVKYLLPDDGKRATRTPHLPWRELKDRLSGAGWLDLVALRYAARINTLTHLAITKLDVLSGFDELLVCTRYRGQEGAEFDRFPYHQSVLHHATPEYEVLPGWSEDISTARSELRFPGAIRPSSAEGSGGAAGATYRLTMCRAIGGSNASPQASGLVHTMRQIASSPSHSSSAVVPAFGGLSVWNRAPLTERSPSEPARSPKHVRRRAGQSIGVRGEALLSSGIEAVARPKVMLCECAGIPNFG